MRYTQDKIEEVRARADIVDVIGAHVRLRRSGRNFTGLCPFHDEKTPSFSVSPERGFFHCFGCGAGGTVFDFVMRHEGQTFPEALQSLAHRFGISLPEPAAGGGARVEQNERDALFAANQIAAEFYAYVLWNSSEGAAAREYIKTRGITVETAQVFMIGFAPARPANLAAALQKRGLTEAGLRLGLLRKDERGGPYDMFRARLIFPIRDAQGRAVAFGGRVLDDRQPKYINSPESPLYSKARTVYGLHEARAAIHKADRAIIVEGYIDTIALAQAGYKETVASLGTSLTVEQLRLLSRYTRNLIACFDGDAAGRKASVRALEVFLDAGLLGRGAFIPPGYDPDTLVRQRGAQAFDEVIKSADLLVDYFLREQVSEARGSTDGRARAAARVTEILAKIRNPFEFDLLARRAAGMLGVSEDVLRREARKPGRANNPGGVRRPLPDKSSSLLRNPASIQAQLGLLMLALRFPAIRLELRERLGRVANQELTPLIAQICQSEEPINAFDIDLKGRLSDDLIQRFSASMVEAPTLNDEQAGQLLSDYLYALEESSRMALIAEHRVAAASTTGEAAAAAAQQVINLRRQSERH